MANIINALRNISSDSWWFVKIAVMTIPVFYFFENTSPASFDFNMMLPYFILFAILYLGVVAVLMHRNIANESPLLPSLFSIPDFIKKAIGLSVVSLPMYILYFYLMYYVYNNFEFETYMMLIIYIGITLLCAPFIFIPSVLYCVHCKISDAFNFKIILEAGGNFVVQFLAFIIQYFFTIFLLTLLFFHMFKNMLEDSMFLNLTVSISFVVSLLTIYSYCSDLYGDVIPQIKKKKKQVKKEDS